MVGALHDGLRAREAEVAREPSGCKPFTPIVSSERLRRL